MNKIKSFHREVVEFQISKTNPELAVNLQTGEVVRVSPQNGTWERITLNEVELSECGAHIKSK